MTQGWQQAPLRAEAPLLLEIFHSIFQAVDVQELLAVDAAADVSSTTSARAAGAGGCAWVSLTGTSHSSP